ncbi:MAG: LysR family transcriptional regulator [Oscillospiraceae bacterium]|nr:LysR family transcriptional regulator [Oscillospiraceae bacterium]
MTFEQIFMVSVLAQEGHFSNAVDACFISQSSFSKHIQSVEEELGTKLFTRKKMACT